jgi:hypothetical protein
MQKAMSAASPKMFGEEKPLRRMMLHMVNFF